jgi:trk system potassium uptake protein TrkH
VTGLVLADTYTQWSAFGQGVILMMIEVGGLGFMSAASLAYFSLRRKISIQQQLVMAEAIGSNMNDVVDHQKRLLVRAFAVEGIGAAILTIRFLTEFPFPQALKLGVFHAVSAFCNAGFDILGIHTGEFSSLTAFASDLPVVIVTCLLITAGGIGFLTWEDMASNKLHFKRYRMQSKTILAAAGILVLIPMAFFFFTDFSGMALKERICLSLFQAVTPRTAGFNTADLPKMTGPGLLIIGVLMLIGGAPGSTAGGMKTTTAAVIFANMSAVIRRKKSARMFGRRVEDSAVKNAATLLLLYLSLVSAGAVIISIAEGLPVGQCLFETASAIGTVGLTLGITPGLCGLSRAVLEILMFFGRVGGLTLMYAAISSRETEIAQYPVEKITVG